MGRPKNLSRVISPTYAAAVAGISSASISVCHKPNTRSPGAPKPNTIPACIAIAAAEMTRLTHYRVNQEPAEIQRRPLVPVDPRKLPRNPPRIAESLEQQELDVLLTATALPSRAHEIFHVRA
jgi:hypothetical protein